MKLNYIDHWHEAIVVPDPSKEDRIYDALRGASYGCLEYYYEQGLFFPAMMFFNPDYIDKNTGVWQISGLVNLVAGSHLQIYDIKTGDELYNEIITIDITKTDPVEVIEKEAGIKSEWFRRRYPATLTIKH